MTSKLMAVGWRCSLGIVVLLCGCNTSYGPFRVVSGSMAPLVRDGDRIMVDESEQARTDLHDGDVVLIRHGDAVVLKRILAMPGETISSTDRKVSRDGKPVAETYLAPPGEESERAPATFAARKTGPGELFVMGDNRDRSLDSRDEEYGPVRLGDVVGKYGWTYWHGSAEASKDK